MAKKPASSMPLPVGNLTSRLREVNRWRDGLNPMRALTIRRAVTLLESYALGEFTELMWTFGHPSLGIETLDADISGLLTRRTAAIQKLDWDIKTKHPKTAGFDAVLAEEQAAGLRERYEGIDNLPEAVAHFCTSTFRGFALLEKWFNRSGALFHLEIIDHWNVVRDGSRGEWKYNADARATTFAALAGEPLPAERLLVRESKRPINMYGLLKYVRSNLGEKNWDAFLEIFGIPGGVVIMPPNVPPDREAEYQESAGHIARGGSGSLPHGATYTANDSPRGTQPFKDRLTHLSEKIVLIGTGGKLTMLASPTGIGGGPSEEQADVFDDIAKAEAAEISAVFQRDLDTAFFASRWPGRPALAYFQLAGNEETDVSAFVTDVATLAQAGYETAPAQIKEKTNMEVTVRPPQPPQQGGAF